MTCGPLIATKQLVASSLAVLLIAHSCWSQSNNPPAPKQETLERSSQLEPLDAALPEGKETDPLAIHAAQGITDIPNRSLVESLKGRLKMAPHTYEGLAPKRKIQGVFKVFAESLLQFDAAGVGPFCLVRENDKFFVLTESNFAKVFGPISNEKQVLPYVKAYSDVFLMWYGNLVTRKEGYSEGNNMFYPKAPEATTIRKARNGFRVRLVFYTILHEERFTAVDIMLQPDGTVKKVGEKVIKDIGPGIAF